MNGNKTYIMKNRLFALLSLLAVVWLSWRYRAYVSITIDMGRGMAFSEHDCTGKPYPVQLELVEMPDIGVDHDRG